MSKVTSHVDTIKNIPNPYGGNESESLGEMENIISLFETQAYTTAWSSRVSDKLPRKIKN